jgi:hypothetical protein
VVIDPDGNEIDRFAGQVRDDMLILEDQWVIENIVPVVDLPPSDSPWDLCEEFWSFWLKHRESSLCVADFGSIVEGGLMRVCVEHDLEERKWLGPYPQHELGTALLMAGIDPDISRRDFCGRSDLVQHDPVDDAIVAALCWQKVVP